MRSRFDEQLEQMQRELIQMGGLIESAIALACEALTKQDKSLAKQVMRGDAEINEMEKEIERICLKLILHQQPIATDLRLISTALKMITDMERIGDHAADISEVILMLPETVCVIPQKHIPEMAEATIHMVGRSIEAYVNKDLDLANAVIQYDDVVDELFDQSKFDLIKLIGEDPQSGEHALDMLLIAKYFERIGDHAVNIAEWVIFSITGQHKNERIL